MSNWGPVVYLAGLLKPILGGIEGFVHDWGLAVILLTLMVRICLFPMSIRQARFAWKNRLFTRAMRDLREKLKDKPDQLKESTQILMREHKFNPLSPLGTMLLQMPIFAAVYGVFYHFGGNITSALVPWAHALSHSDPFHIMPFVVAGLTGLGVLVPMLQPETVEGVSLVKKFMPLMYMLPVMLF
ncbi:MAG TPA: YidC/Oxa1 family membrane protein insertase, partial [Bacilli bacterium]|nr:YidC/Oxa1 family membrane protein insertase [Bacilli bacterium]